MGWWDLDPSVWRPGGRYEALCAESEGSAATRPTPYSEGYPILTKGLEVSQDDLVTRLPVLI